MRLQSALELRGRPENVQRQDQRRGLHRPAAGKVSYGPRGPCTNLRQLGPHPSKRFTTLASYHGCRVVLMVGWAGFRCLAVLAGRAAAFASFFPVSQVNESWNARKTLLYRWRQSFLGPR